MAFIDRPYAQKSQLVVREPHAADALARETITVNITAGATLPFGAIVQRAKGASDAAYDVIASAGDLVVTNEFAVVFSDNYFDFKEEIEVPANEDTLVQAYVRGPIVLKRWKMKEYLVDTLGLSEANAETAFFLLSKQDVLSEDTIGSLT